MPLNLQEACNALKLSASKKHLHRRSWPPGWIISLNDSPGCSDMMGFIEPPKKTASNKARGIPTVSHGETKYIPNISDICADDWELC